MSATYEEYKKLAEAYPSLTNDQQEYLAARAAMGNQEARELLFKYNARRILYFADLYASDGRGAIKNINEVFGESAPYIQRWRYYGPERWRQHVPKELDTDEILSAAAQGLWRAITTFDPARGKFNQHANVLIWQAIMDARKKVEASERRLLAAAEWQYPKACGDLHAPRIHQESSVPESESTDDAPDDKSAETEKAIARVLFEKYVQEFLDPADSARLLALLEGKASDEAEPMNKFLERVGKILREKIPERDFAWLAEYLG